MASRNKLQILQIVAGMDIGGAYGGAERFGLELSRHLDRALFDISVCAFWRRGTKQENQWYERLQSEGINVFFIEDWGGKSRLWAYLRGLRNLEKHCVPPVDIIHSHFAMGALLAILLRISGHARIAMRTVHTIPLDWGLGITGWICRQVFQRWLIPLMIDAEVGVSQVVADKLQSHPGARLIGKRSYLIYNAISMDRCADQGNTPDEMIPSLNQGELVIGSIGRLAMEKGYIYLVEALPIVLAELPNVRLVLVGDGYLRDSLQQRARQLHVDEEVLFVGQRDDAIAFLKHMDLFVLTSLSESLPTVVLESMACGIPVVATDIPGTRELIQHGETGWLVPPATSSPLAHAIVRLLGDSLLRKQLSIRARKWVSNFSMDTIANQYARLYHSIALGEAWQDTHPR